MATLKDVRGKIEEYSSTFRKESLPAIEDGRVYGLYGGALLDGTKPDIYWPEQWPLADRRGIYAIFSHEKLLYIGKASLQDLGHRLYDYFKEGEQGECVVNKHHTWSAEPTHLVTWAVPDEYFFEAAALEEFLIDALGAELPDNTTGKNARPIRKKYL